MLWMSLSFFAYYKRVNSEKLGRTSDEDDVSYENVKKATGLLNKMYISFLSLRDYDMKMPTFTFYGR